MPKRRRRLGSLKPYQRKKTQLRHLTAGHEGPSSSKPLNANDGDAHSHFLEQRIQQRMKMKMVSDSERKRKHREDMRRRRADPVYREQERIRAIELRQMKQSLLHRYLKMDPVRYAYPERLAKNEKQEDVEIIEIVPDILKPSEIEIVRISDERTNGDASMFGDSSTHSNLSSDDGSAILTDRECSFLSKHSIAVASEMCNEPQEDCNDILLHREMELVPI